MKASINGVDFTNVILGLDAFSLTYGRDSESDAVNVEFSSELTFIGGGYEFLKDLFFSTAEGSRQSVEIALDIECCDLPPQKLIIVGDSATICPHTCEIIVRAQLINEDIAALNILKSKLIWEDNNFIDQNHPKICTCKDGGVGQLVGFIITSAIAQIPFLGPLITQIGDFFSNIIGCGFHHPAPYVIDYLENIAAQLGVTLQTSIFTSAPYDKAVFLSAYPDGGSKDLVNWIEANAPNLTGAQFLDILANVFNIDYRIKDGVLTVERRDYFLAGLPVLYDIEAITDEKRNNPEGVVPCYAYKTSERFAYGQFSYTRDNIDRAGNSTFEFYNTYVDWNIPIDETRRGGLIQTMPISSPYFIGQSPSDYNPSNINGARLYAGALGYLLLTEGQSFIPKILLVDVVDTATNKAIGYNVDVFGAGNDEMKVNEQFPTSELYQNFWSIEDPRVNLEPYTLDSFSFVATCAEIQQIIDNKIDFKVNTAFGEGLPETVEINFNNGVVTLNNITIIG